MFQYFKTGIAAALNAGAGADNQRKTAMEADTIQHGRSSTSQKSRVNFLWRACFAALAVTMLFAAGGCRSKKELPTIQAGSERITIPFSSDAYRTNSDNFRAVNMGTSVDYSMARRIALQNARTELSAGIASTVRAVTAQYADQRQVGNRQEFQTRMEEESRTVVNQMLNDVRVIGDEVFREPDGRMTVWVAIEMAKDALMNSMNDRLSRDERLRLDYDQHRFRQIFDEEMRKFETNR